MWGVATPDAILLALICLACLCLWLRGWRTGRAILTLAVFLALLVSLLPFGAWLVRPLEDRFPRVDALPPDIAGIVVLGGAVNQFVTQDRHQTALTDAAERMTEFVALARRHPGLRLAFLGGSASLAHPEIKETIVARRLFAELGLPLDRVIFEDQSTNTYENARLGFDAVKPGAARWALVTSASHMPRAVGVFRKAGWRVLPYPVDYRTTSERHLIGWNGLLGGLGGLAYGLHEWIGLLGYRITGRSDELFPGPNP